MPNGLAFARLAGDSGNRNMTRPLEKRRDCKGSREGVKI
jgi:hypothetical protein